MNDKNSSGPASAGPDGPEAESPTVVIRDTRRIDPHGTSEAGSATGEESNGESIVLDVTPIAPGEADEVIEGEVTGGEEDTLIFVELETLRGDLGELTRDLQRVSAEYANYRKRVDRDRTLAGDQATGTVITALLPVLDDLDRARNHGDLVGPFASVAEQLSAALGKFGLAPFGESGDPFDPTLHEAVAHMSSPDVTETTCVEVMRRGYLLGERLLRPALVAVADPE